MKAKYFPSCKFSESTLGSSPSFKWRSIFEAKTVIKYGFVWRVGNGQTINIWKDPWIPGFNAILSPSNETGSPHITHVCFLIDSNRQWYRTSIQMLFNREVLEAIMRIPISITPCAADKLTQALESNGRFTMKSTYRVALNMGTTVSNIQQGRVEDCAINEATWRFFWKIETPNKVKLFAWRA
ncbi:hypothetical protein CFOL_v3_19956 [Cephalotus follicularis]|uniref:Zf-RVT domain-containing protein n=1 Tax=Cephalotus follicularis TaxID=3775 RepID=A0A1Q3C8Q8_CEPFO|nr:hypothetical protein CFOL_v3_19956 [Cephalotus follicularis]